jgi:hypothetical protein
LSLAVAAATAGFESPVSAEATGAGEGDTLEMLMIGVLLL